MADGRNELAVYEGNRQGARVTMKSTLRAFHEVCDEMDMGVRILTEELERANADLDDLIILTEAGLARAGVPYEAPGAVLPAVEAELVSEGDPDQEAASEAPTDVQRVITVEFDHVRGDDAPMSNIPTPLGDWQLRRTDR